MLFDSEAEMTQETGKEHEWHAPTAPGAMTEKFAKGRKGESSQELQEFIALLKSLQAGPQPAQDVAYYQRLSDVPVGETPRKRC
jgi:hypothetical protein